MGEKWLGKNSRLVDWQLPKVATSFGISVNLYLCSAHDVGVLDLAT